ncbi:MAG: UDP-N-acetylmuramate dehydrogenase [Actinobacteria bacterium]|nr:UDP-N-acetylmuramate dehydrogenase [Actinomycetota bacterium]
MRRLAELTTLRVGGMPNSMAVATTETEIIEAVSANPNALVLGGGSNIIVSDDFNGDVIKIESQGFENDESACAGAWVTVAAGHNWNDFAASAVVNGWTGIEGLAGIPGTVGATPIQNVGAYGQSVSDTIAQVRAWNKKTKSVETIFAADCEFGYRTSIFKKQPDTWVILSVTFQLPLGTMSAPIAYNELATKLKVELSDRVSTTDLQTAVLDLRSRKGMVLDSADHDTWSVGSFFMNPRVAVAPANAPNWPEADGTVKVSAAWLIEQAGFNKGFTLNGRAAISSKHTLAITNRGNATSADISELADHIVQGVKAKFDIELKPEATFIS